FLIIIGVMALLRPLTVVVHELGHCVAAFVVGEHVVRVVFGTGPTVAASQTEPAFELRRYLFAGGHMLSYPVTDNPSKWRRAIVLLGGVAANATLGAVFTWIFVRYASTTEDTSATWVAIGIGAILSQATTIAVNLSPYYNPRDRTLQRSDGQQLIDLYRSRNF